MPLSRLTPRSTRTCVARQKTSTREKSDTQRHLYLWAAIRKTRQELDQWDQRALQVDALFTQHITPREYKLTRAVSDVTTQLMNHFASGDLDIPDQSLLGLWITDNLNSLQDHPFADPHHTGKLNAEWLELLNNDGPVENQLARLARQHNFSTYQAQDRSATPEEAMSSTTEAHDNDSDSTEQQNARATQHENDAPETTDDTESVRQQHIPNPPIEDKIKTLEDKLSVERLFRQLAKVLHPDREQDDAAKAAKHVLMSECLKARQEKDIQALLTLYCEHVGDLPDDLNNNSHSELVNALEVQLRQLQLELREKRFGDPLHTMIIERYASSAAADSEQRISNHAQSLDDEITAARRLIRQLAQHDGLLDALDERRAVEQDRMAINEMTGM